MANSAANQAFKEARQLRLDILGSFCECCSKPTNKLVGHHVYGRKAGRNSWSDCQIRCTECETKLHQKYTDGNSDESLRIFFKNNTIIAQALAG